MTITHEQVGPLVRQWRERRRRSQLDVSIAAEMSARHLSFIETGRSKPSREAIGRICDELDVPLRERNRLYLAAGFAPVHAERSLADLGSVRPAIEALLSAHEPYPAMAVNVQWELLVGNVSATSFLGGAVPGVHDQPVNVLRATLHPDGLASRLRNYAQWRAHLVHRVRRQLERTAAAGLADLLDEIESYPVPPGTEDVVKDHDLVVPMVIASGDGDLTLLYSLTVFGAPRDVTLDEISIETFFPADEATRTWFTSGRPGS